MPISFSVVCAAISAKPYPTPSITEIVPAVANIFLFATLEDSLANSSGFKIISLVTSSATFLPIAVLVAVFKACFAAVPTTAFPTRPPIPPLIKFNGSVKATPKFL